MKKVIRLTETDLTNLVKRVIEEQNSQIIAKVRLTPEGDESLPLNLDIVNKKTKTWGCEFEGRSGNTNVKLNFICGKDENTPLGYTSTGSVFKSGLPGKGKLTKQGHDMLSKKCGCDAYVKSSGSDTGSYV
jgi:hypothetical protein